MKDPSKLDRVVAEARRAAAEREQGYREQALKTYPWICGRCAREFTRANLRELTVHHRDHDHGNNTGSAPEGGSAATHSPFANLKALLDGKKAS